MSTGYGEAIKSLLDKWDNPNGGATTDELEQLSRALELAIDDVKQTIKLRKEEEGPTQQQKIIEKIEEWKKLDEMKQTADDHTRCPKCKDQLFFCDCCGVIGDELLMNHADWILEKAKEK